MADRRFAPPMGTPIMLEHYIVQAQQMAADLGQATPMLDRAAELYAKTKDKGAENKDVAVMVEILEGLPR
jgi:3-hydroxyisobutyrate dehydrogenase-like beta-hydroxyacid dehydrogenase